MPSAANSLTGIKPSWGRVSRYGVIPLGESFDHIGPMARSAVDAAALLGAIAGGDPLDQTAPAAPVPDYLVATSRGVDGLVIGMDQDFAEAGVPEEIVQTLRRGLEIFTSLGARVRKVRVPEHRVDLPLFIAQVSAEMAAAQAGDFGLHRAFRCG